MLLQKLMQFILVDMQQDVSETRCLCCQDENQKQQVPKNTPQQIPEDHMWYQVKPGLSFCKCHLTFPVHHHPAIYNGLVHQLTHSGLTHPAIFPLVSPSYTSFLSVDFYYPRSLSRGILFICCIQFILQSYILSKCGLIFNF